MSPLKRCSFALQFLILLLFVAGPSVALAADSDSALIVFFRPKRYTGSGLTPSIYLDGQQIARLDNGRYFSIPTTPGKHKFDSSMKESGLELEVKPGERIYLEMVILMGTWRGGGRLIPAPASDAVTAIQKIKPLDAKWVIDKRVVFEYQPTQTNAAAPAATTMPPPAPLPSHLASVQVSSDPTGADVELNSKFVGNTPTTLRLEPGEYTITVRKAGHQAWERKILALAENEMKLTAELPKIDQ